MKHFRRTRIIALFLAVVMLLALLLPSVAAQTGTLEVNTAVRHKVCTALSAQAEAYYSGDYGYDILSSLAGVYAPDDSWQATQNNPLYSALQKLMTDTHTNQNVAYSGYSSNALATYWASTDAAAGTESYLYFYTDIDSADGAYTMNREHVWPKSKASYYQRGGGADLHHLRPSIAGVNSAKSNSTFGNQNGGGSAYKVNGEAVIWTGGGKLEVRDNVKGDVARILLYVYCRWGQPNLYSDVDSSKLPPLDSDDSSNSGARAIDSFDTLLEWMELDPVDDWEMMRNDQAENVQGNRNVFIDYPEYAWLMFGMDPPADFETPSGMAILNAHNWDEGDLLTEPTCTENGTMRFTCLDCGMTRDRQIPALGHEKGAATEQQPAACTEDGFINYICSRCGETLAEVQPATGHSFEGGVCSVCGHTVAVFQLTNTLADGDLVIVYNPSADAAMSSEIRNRDYRGYETVQPVNGCIYTESNAVVWTVSKEADGFVLTANDGTVLATDAANSVPAGGRFRVWQLSPAATEGCVYLLNNGDKYLEWNTKYADFASYYYTEEYESGLAMQIYTQLVCKHTDTELRSKDATCTESGYSDASFCVRCGAKLSDGTVIPPLGHDYADTVTAPTCESKGYTVHICSRCGDEYADALTPVLGHDLGSWVTVQQASCTQAGLRERKCSRCDYAETELLPASCCFSADYTDTPDTENWAHAGIDFCIGRDIMGSTKTETLTFEPGSTTTRAMIVSILYRLSGSPAVEYKPVFSDIADGKWYTDAVLWAHQAGVVVGYQDGTFGPNDLVTREQIAVILKGYTENVLGRPAEERAALTAFADADKLTWSNDAVQWAVAIGLISGKDGARLDPQGDATRAEVAAILMRYCTAYTE